MKSLNFDIYAKLVESKCAQLKPPIVQEAISLLEKRFTATGLPRQLIDLLKMGDGQDRHVGPGLFGEQSLESSKGILGWIDWHHEEEQETTSDCFSECPLVRQGQIWRPEWLPFTFSPESVFLYVDCAPSARGNYGQIILSSIHTGKCGVVAKDLNELITLSLRSETRITNWPLLVD